MSLAAHVLAQAKVNLRLRVLAREASGYHSIETIFLRLELADDVRVRLTSGRTIDCAGPAMPPGGLGVPETNLAYQAAAAYADATGWPRGFAIEIEKRIPVGGGLGGGSADAGAVLRALDALSPRRIRRRVADLATALGADVPFMTTADAMALGWGRGERLLALPAPPTMPVLLAVPAFGIATADAYRWLSEIRDVYIPTANIMDVRALGSWNTLSSLAVNDFETVVAERHPEVGHILEHLRGFGAAVAMLSGSGSTVFGVFDESRAPDPDTLSERAECQVIQTRTSDRVGAVAIEGSDN